MNRTSASLLCLFLGALSAAALPAADLKFAFGPSPAQPGFTPVAPDAVYDAQKHFGFLPADATASNRPKVFAVDLPEGNYDVTVRLGDAKDATDTTLKAKSRRLVLHHVGTKAGEFVARTFTVNVRQPAGGVPKLNDRELGPPATPDWDNRLTLEFNGTHPGVASVEITPAPKSLTVFLAGDSTVTDQRNEPFAGWGQMLPRFFSPGVAVSNHAESGLALFSFEHQKRLQKITDMMKPGDYLFIQFGHNDQKDKSKDAGPFTTYKANLKKFVAAARAKGGLPVIVTPMERRRWQAGVPAPTLQDYAEAGRKVGREENIPVIDLNAMSLKLYAALGEEGTKKAFVFFPAGSFGREREFKDNTHHTNYGGYELARCVVEGIKAGLPELAKRLAPDAGSFNPDKPDSPEAVAIPLSPLNGPVETPAGS